MVAPRRSHAPSRPSCTACVEKHLGAAHVLLTGWDNLPDLQAGLPAPPAPLRFGAAGDEAGRRHGFPRRLRALGHLFGAEDESRQCPELHTTIRAARWACQADGQLPVWDNLDMTLTQRHHT